MSNLAQRILTAIFAGGALVSAIIFSEYGMMVFCALVSVLGMLEWLRVTGSKVAAPALVVLAGIVLVWAWQLTGLLPGNLADLPGEMLILVLILPAAGILSLFRQDIDDPVRAVGLLILGAVYIFVPFFLFYKMSFVTEYNFRIPLGILFLNWLSDTFAYFGGRFMGKHKLFERHSPKKTWEGSVTGALGCIGLGVLFQFVWPLEWNWIAVAAVVAVVSQFGDLVESMFKRSLDIKDSGSILPGHGGLLDRFDGMFISLPVIYAYQQAEIFFR